jgi:aminoglycoside 6-adenylyltransferase
MTHEQEAAFVQWGQQQDTVRAMVLTSSRAIPAGPVDLFSDYDLILILTAIHPFFESRAWLGGFGPVLAVYRDPIILNGDLETSAYVTQYENGLKIDFTLWPVELLARVVAEPGLPDEFDAGYRVVLDKDGLTVGLKSPTYAAYIPKPPTQTDYQNVIEEFFLDAGYVAKFLWRDDLMAAKHLLDSIIKQDYLRPMLEWRSEIDHQWSVKPGPYGRRLKQWLRADLWGELESTYTGAQVADNWQALFKTITLFRRVAVEVGERLGYIYPHDLDRRAVAYLRKVKNLDHQAKSFT